MARLLKGSPRSLRREISKSLADPSFPQTMSSLVAHSPKTVVNALLPYLCHANVVVKWNSVLGVGVFTKSLANENREEARLVMRRLIWTLNEECGGIGWGTPEGMAEIMVHDSQMADEYMNMLTSFLIGEGNFLEFEPLQAGVLWGLGRLSTFRFDLLIEKDIASRLPFYFGSPDASVRGYAAWVAGCLRASALKSEVLKLVSDNDFFQNFIQLKIVDFKISDVAKEAIRAIESEEK